jgi:hypothetical protein
MALPDSHSWLTVLAMANAEFMLYFAIVAGLVRGIIDSFKSR